MNSPPLPATRMPWAPRRTISAAWRRARFRSSSPSMNGVHIGAKMPRGNGTGTMGLLLTDEVGCALDRYPTRPQGREDRSPGLCIAVSRELEDGSDRPMLEHDRWATNTLL